MLRIGCLARRLVFLAIASASLSAPAYAAGERWGADDLRRVMIDWLREQGREAPAPGAIGPLDPRLSLSACDKVEIAPRGASATSFSVSCSAPSVWRYVLRVDNIAPIKSAGPAPAASTAASSWRVVVPRVDLPAGAVLTADVIEEREVNVAPAAFALKSEREAVGLRLVSAIGPGMVLTTRNIARTPLVAKGENVTLVANGAGFEIVMPGRAEQDGYEGELIVVRNLRSGATIKGRVEKNKIISVLTM